MASKAELEAENVALKAKVAELEAKVASGASPDTVPLADLAALATELEGVRGELDVTKEVAKLTESELKQKIQDLGRKLADKPLVEVAGDAVFIGGKLHKIVGRNTTKEIGFAVQKRFLPEDATCLVIERTGE